MHSASQPAVQQGFMLNTVSSAPKPSAQEHTERPAAANSVDESIVGALQRLLSKQHTQPQRSRHEDRWNQPAEEEHQDLSDHLRALSKPQLRALVRVLLRPRHSEVWGREEERGNDVHR
eukprot:815920-Rhodomonas_salina.1